MEELLKKIRLATEEDKEHMPVFSYSKFDVFKKCPMQYYIKYEEGKRPIDESTIALELGTLCHLVLENKGKMLESGKVDYNKLSDILIHGCTETDDKTQEPIPGTEIIKKKYFEDWYAPDNVSGTTYEDKLKTFNRILHSEMEDSDWKPKYFEFPFEFVWDNKIIITGFIDRIDYKKVDEKVLFKCVDYKTSKKIYSKSDVATSMQFAIYSMAILLYFDTLPEECEYRFIFIDEKQLALTPGWIKRIIKTLDGLLEQVEVCKTTHIYKPKPTPLCHWCSYCQTNTNAHKYKNECQYYSLWTPNNKTFETNKTFSTSNNIVNTGKRKIIF